MSFLPSGRRSASGGGFEGFSGGSAGFEDVFDVFGDIFGGGRRGAMRGNDLEYTLQVSLEESAFGCEMRITGRSKW